MKKIFLCFSIIALVRLPAGAVAVDDKSMTPGDIISKHLAAIGGKDALAKVKTRIAIGSAKVENLPNIPISVASEVPNRLSAIYQFPDYNWKLIYDGKRSIFKPQMSGGTALVEQKYEDMLATGTMFNDISLFNQLLDGEAAGTKIEAKGTKKLHGRAAYVLEIKPRKGALMRAFFDAENFMWVRTEYGSVTIRKTMGAFSNDVTNKDDETPVSFYVETSDFRQVDGLTLPFKFEQVVTAPILRLSFMGTITGTITEYHHNEPINPRMYQ